VPAGARALRVVSDALDGKGTIERIVCDDAGRAPLRLLRRDRGDSGRSLAHSRRGDVLVAEGEEPMDLELRRPADE
jgi:hypothetical protein